MATAILCCTLVLLLYLQENCAQQGLPNNQNEGVNNAIGFQQQALQRTNPPNNMNQIPSGGLNMNFPSKFNFQQGNLQQALSGNFQGNLHPSLNLQANLQPQDGSVSLGNLQFTKQWLQQLPPGLVINPSKSQSGLTQTNNDCRQNVQTNQQQNNMGPTSNISLPQTQNAPCSSNSLAELAALKGHPSLLSLFGSQSNVAQPQPNQQIANFNPSQNQLTDVQKQFLVRAIQSQSSEQNQPAGNFPQTQFQVGGGVDNRPIITIQGPPPQQAQAIVAPIVSQPPYIIVQAQPLTNYMQNQPPQLVEEPSMLNLILSEFQTSDPQYNMFSPYPVQKRESKSSLKTLIPLIINLLKEKNTCCQNSGCPNPNNGCGSNKVPEPTIFGGYSSLMNYGQGTAEATTKASEVEEKKSKSNKKEQKKTKKIVVKVDSEEESEENDSEEADYSEED